MSPLTVVFALACVAVASASVVPALDLEEFNEWEGRIVGGNNAGTGQFPFQVSLQTNANSHFCGGSIISNRWIVTAAHCTIGRAPGAVRVRVQTLLHNSGGISHQASQIRNHPQYNPNTLANDVSTVQTASVIGFNGQVGQIAMGTGNIGTVGATASGWGQLGANAGIPSHLQFINTNTLTLADCRARHSVANRARVFDNTICTFLRSGHGTCMGDSGGPLISGGFQIGIVSWGIPCGAGFPDVYVRISSQRTWILQNS